MSTLTRSRVARYGLGIFAAALLAGVAGGAAPASAHDWDRGGWEGHHRHYRDWDRPRGYYYPPPPPVYYAPPPPVYYPPPPVYYAPPPPRYYGPPGVGVYFNLR